jgi:hypothetical protein
MTKAYLPVVLILTGCAAQPEQPISATSATFADTGAAAAESQLLAAVEPAAELDVTDFTSTTTCRKVVNTGSRLIRGEICTSSDNVSVREKDYQAKKLEWEIDDFNRLREEEVRRYQQEEMRFSRPQPR